MKRSPVPSLSWRAFTTLERIGDWYCPGDEEFPSFSKLGCAEHAERVLSTVPLQDKKDLEKLLHMLSYLPSFLLSFFLWLCEKSPAFSGTWASPLRLARLALRGLCFSLYYSGLQKLSYRGAHPLQLIAYEVHVPPVSPEKETTSS